MEDIEDQDPQLSLFFEDLGMEPPKKTNCSKKSVPSSINDSKISSPIYIERSTPVIEPSNLADVYNPDIDSRILEIESKLDWIKEWCLQRDKKDSEDKKWLDLSPLNLAIKEEPLLISLRLPRIQDWPVLSPVKKRHSQFGDIAMLYIILLKRPCSTWDFFYAGETGEVLNRFFNHDAINALSAYEIDSYEVRYQLLKNSEYKGTGLNAQANRKQLEKALCRKLTPTWDFWLPSYRMKFKKKEIPKNEIWEHITLRS